MFCDWSDNIKNISGFINEKQALEVQKQQLIKRLAELNKMLVENQAQIDQVEDLLNE